MVPRECGQGCLAILLLLSAIAATQGQELAEVPSTRDQALPSRSASLDPPTNRPATQASRREKSARTTTASSVSREASPTPRPWYELEELEKLGVRANPEEQPAKRARKSWLGNTSREALTQQLVGRTLLVTTIFAGVGLVVVAIAHRVQIRKQAGGRGRSMALLDTLQLAPRCTLQLIRIDSQKFLVARDAGGVRSVTPVQSFAETIDQVNAASPLEEAVAQTETWDQGLSLEATYRNRKDNLPLRSRGNDPWQENTWNR